MQSMTYGNLPTREQFDVAFDAECPGGFRIVLNPSDSRAVDGFKLGDGCLTADQLWSAITEIVDRWRTDTGDEAGEYQDQRVDLVSSILYALGFEWI